MHVHVTARVESRFWHTVMLLIFFSLVFFFFFFCVQGLVLGFIDQGTLHFSKASVDATFCNKIVLRN